jgi:hypothetical protein
MAEKWFRDSRHRDEFYTDKNYQKAVLRENEELLQKGFEQGPAIVRDVGLSAGAAGVLMLGANARKIGEKAIEPYAMNDPRGKVPLLPDGPQVNPDYRVTRGKPGAPHQQGPKIAVRRESPSDSEPDAPRKPGVKDIQKLVGVKRSFFDQAIWPHNAGLQKAKEVKSDPSDDSDPAEQHFDDIMHHAGIVNHPDATKQERARANANIGNSIWEMSRVIPEMSKEHKGAIIRAVKDGDMEGLRGIGDTLGIANRASDDDREHEARKDAEREASARF